MSFMVLLSESVMRLTTYPMACISATCFNHRDGMATFHKLAQLFKPDFPVAAYSTTEQRSNRTSSLPSIWILRPFTILCTVIVGQGNQCTDRSRTLLSLRHVPSV